MCNAVPVSHSTLHHHHLPLHLRRHVWGRGARAAHVPLCALDGAVREQPPPAAGQQRGGGRTEQDGGVGCSWRHGMVLGAWSAVGDVGHSWGCGMELGDTGWGWWFGTGTVWVRVVLWEGNGVGQEMVWDMRVVFAPLDLADILRGALPHLAHGCLLHLHRLHLQRVLQQSHRHLPLRLERGHHGQPLFLEVGSHPCAPCLSPHLPADTLALSPALNTSPPTPCSPWTPMSPVSSEGHIHLGSTQ